MTDIVIDPFASVWIVERKLKSGGHERWSPLIIQYREQKMLASFNGRLEADSLINFLRDKPDGIEYRAHQYYPGVG